MAEWLAAPAPAAAATLEAAGFPAWLAAVLARRGVEDAGQAEAFLHPSRDQLHDPFLLAGMEGAVERLLAARAAGCKVAVVGDYDVDGVTATALLLAVMRACGLEAEAVLPHRMREGYGFQAVHVERARERGCSLIVTVDCGATSVAAAEAALAAGLEVVITDHHLPGTPLPPGVALINPRQARCAYPYPDLAGVGLALKLGLALAARCGRPIDLDALLRVACLGTIADLAPLTGENRVIAALGLRGLAGARSAGLRALLRQAGVEPPVSAADVGFRLGPRLNAAGRLDSAESALELLLCRDPERAAALAAELDLRNRERRAEEARVVEEARQRALARQPLPPLIVEWAATWHRGVVGIAAGRLARELARPVVLLAVSDGVATGSGRSIPGVHLHDFLARWEGDLERFGGHAQAVGLTVDAAQLDRLRRLWEEAAEEFADRVGQQAHHYELELAAEQIDEPLLSRLGALVPHGQGNPEPLARIGPLTLAGPPRLFGNGHLSARARGSGGGSIRLLGWGWAERPEALTATFEVLGHVERDRFDGAPVVRLRDARPR
jgi:single-stranded-DNA-specific exonuclease